jgi:protein gp37
MTKKERMFGFVGETWNPVKGCTHGCQYCWAKRMAKWVYGDAFTPKIFENRLRYSKKNKWVFVCDMGDLFCKAIPSEWIEEVIKVVAGADPSNTFLFLTKNPRRFFEFLGSFSPNCILGCTIETNRDEIVGKISKAPRVSERYKAMVELDWPRKMLSIEPIMDFDLEVFLDWISHISPEICAIGYDN